MEEKNKDKEKKAPLELVLENEEIVIPIYKNFKKEDIYEWVDEVNKEDFLMNIPELTEGLKNDFEVSMFFNNKTEVYEEEKIKKIMEEMKKNQEKHEDFTRKVFDFLAGYFFKMQFRNSKNSKDAYLVKLWISYLIDKIDKGYHHHIEVLEEISVHTELPIDDVRKDTSSIYPNLLNVKNMYEDDFLKYTLNANEKAYTILSSIYEGAISEKELDILFDERLHIGSRLSSMLTEEVLLNEYIIEEAYDSAEFKNIKFKDLSVLAKEVEDYLIREYNGLATEGITLEIVVFDRNDKGLVEAVWLDDWIDEEENIGNYLIGYFLSYGRGEKRRLKRSDISYIYNLSSFYEFVLFCESIVEY